VVAIGRSELILTIGHSTRSFDDFLALLRANEVETIADVRSYPGSRKFPHYNAESLSATLPENGISYVSMKQLGGRRKIRPDSPHTVWRHPAFRGYADYMDTPEFESGIADLLEIARGSRTAIMCSEAVWWRCHRSMIADHLKTAGLTVEHIMDGKNAIHPFTSAASIVDGKLFYGPGDQDQTDQSTQKKTKVT
jgi:uncharacterized protein (DUF488 family)